MKNICDVNATRFAIRIDRFSWSTECFIINEYRQFPLIRCMYACMYVHTTFCCFGETLFNKNSLIERYFMEIAWQILSSIQISRFCTKVLSGINKKFYSINLSKPRTSAIRLREISFLFFFLYSTTLATYSSGKSGRGWLEGLGTKIDDTTNTNGPALQFAKFNVVEFKLLDGEINPPNDHHNSPCQRIRGATSYFLSQ